MWSRFLQRAIIALVIYCCIVGVLYWSPGITQRIEPYLCEVLTKDTDFQRVKAVISDFLLHPAPLSQSGYTEYFKFKD
ncbi:MAG: hypothetical protein GX969_01760 [Firmicutes bacterium]|nr:hypothetical protein [Bacillota bacterium]